MGAPRTLPPKRVGRKPLSTHLPRDTKGLLLAAFRVWEIKNHIPHVPSAWEKMRKPYQQQKGQLSNVET